MLLAYATYKDFIVYQIDVMTAFLYDHLKKEVYVSQPEGFVDQSKPDHVYFLHKALYGLKQAPRALYDELSTYQMDVKTAFLYGHLKEEVYVSQP